MLRRIGRKHSRSADSRLILQALAAGLLGAVLLLPSLRAGRALLQNHVAAFGRPSVKLASLAPVSPALREAWNLGRRMVVAAAMGVLSLRWELLPVSCSMRRGWSTAAALMARFCPARMQMLD